jgi:1,4-alpha-glucan branching enzyme
MIPQRNLSLLSNRLAAEAVAAKAQKAQRAEALLASLAARKLRIGVEFYEMGRELAELSDGEYHSALDYPSFAVMIEGRKLMSRAVAWNLMSIYRSLPRKAANQFGPARSIEWLRLLRTEAGPNATDADVRIAARQPAVVQGQRVVDMTSRQLADLRRRTEERRAMARKDPAADQAHKLARALARQRRSRGAEDAWVTARYARASRLRIDLALPAALALSKALGGG